MKKFVTCCLALCLAVPLAFADLTYYVTCKITEEGNADFRIRNNNGNTDKEVTGYGYIQLSRYSDFRSSAYLERFTTKGTALTTTAKSFYTINSADMESGEYYWRVFYLNSKSVNKLPFTGKSTIAFGTKEVETKQETTTDNAVYEDAELSNGITLSLEPVWMRSDVSGTPLPWNETIPVKTSKPIKPTNFAYTPYSHGVIVRDNVIYVARGSFAPLNWNFSKNQLEFDCFDLTTGQQLEQLIVTADGGFYGQSAMGLIGEDADGTIYFTTTLLNSSSLLSGVYLYTVDISDVDLAQGATVEAKLQREFNVPTEQLSANNCHLLTVEGSILNNNYTLWGSSPSGQSTTGGNASDNIFRWIVNENNVDFEYAVVSETVFAVSDNNYLGRLSRVTPLGNDYFYYHSIANDDISCSLVPSLYKFNADNHTCQPQSSASDIEGSLFTQQNHSVLGITRTTFEDRPLIAFGQTSEKGSHLAIAEITDADNMSFSGARLLWVLNPDGFSLNPQQGCDISFVSSTMALDAESPANNFMLAYLPNAGMALYNVSSTNTTGIDLVYDNEACSPRIIDRILYTGITEGSCTITDMAGRTLLTAPCSAPVSLEALPAGPCILTLSESPSVHKLILE